MARRTINYFSYVILSIILLWIFFAWLLPSFFFNEITTIESNKISYNFHSQNKIDNEKLNVLVKNVEKNIAKCYGYQIFVQENKKINLYFCNNKSLYFFLNPLNAKGFASTNLWLKHIYIANIDINTDVSTNFGNEKLLKNEILLSHEFSHLVLNESNLHLKDWELEGYCEYIGYGSKIDVDKFLAKKNESKYFKYVLAVDYLLKKNNGDVNVLKKNNLSYEEIIKLIKKGK